MNFKKFIIAFISLLCFTGITTAYSQVKFSGHITAGTVFDRNYAGITADISLGILFGDIFYIGPEVGIEAFAHNYADFYPYYNYACCTNTLNTAFYVPIGVNTKFNLIRDATVSPYITLSGAYFLGFSEYGKYDGYKAQLGVGMKISYFTVNFGYTLMGNIDRIYNNYCLNPYFNHFGYIKLGFHF